MAKANKRKLVRLESVRPAYEEALGTEGGKYEFVGTDDKVYSFFHPAFMSAEQQKDLDEIEDQDELVQYLLGDQHEQFIAGGNSPEDLLLLFSNVGAEYREKAAKVRISRS